MKPVTVSVSFDSLAELRDFLNDLEGDCRGRVTLDAAPTPAPTPPPQPKAEKPQPAPVVLPGSPPWGDAVAKAAGVELPTTAPAPPEVDLPSEPEPPAADPQKATEADCREALKAYFARYGGDACKAALKEFGAEKVSDLAEFEYATFIRRLEVAPNA